MSDDATPSPVTTVRAPVRAGRTAVALTALVAMIGGLCGLPLGLAAGRLFGALGMVFGVLAVLAVSAWGLITLTRATRFEEREVRFSAEGVEVVGGLAMKKGEITHAAFVPARQGAPAKVSLRTKSATADVVVGSRESARALLHAAGLDARALQLFGVAPFSSPTGRRGLAIVALTLALSVAAGALGASAAFVGALATALLCATVIALVPNEIRVGSDGVLVQNRLDATFHRREDVRGAVATNRGIELDVAGRKVEVPMTSRTYLTELERDDQSALLQAIADMREGAAGADVGWRLERANRPVDEWLRSLLDDPRGYRDGDLTNEALHGVLTGGAKASARLAAALLLSRRGNDDDRARVRVAADAVAEPKLRIALDAVASEVPVGDERLRALAAELDDEEGGRRREG